MKKIFTLALALIMVLSFTACGRKTDPAASASTASGNEADDSAAMQQEQPVEPGADNGKLISKAGDVASYGMYNAQPVEWLCLAVEGNKALLTTRNCIRLDVFHDTDGGDGVAWADCNIRAWLNGEFYDGFTQDEQAFILDTVLASNENMGYNDFPEDNVDWYETTDKVFLLSADEMNRYFTDEEARIAILSLSENALAETYDRYLSLYNYVDEDGTIKSDMYALSGQPVSYWLRSNGRGRMVQTISADGSFDDYGSNQDGDFKGVRPAMWVSIG